MMVLVCGVWGVGVGVPFQEKAKSSGEGGAADASSKAQAAAGKAKEAAAKAKSAADRAREVHIRLARCSALRRLTCSTCSFWFYVSK